MSFLVQIVLSKFSPKLSRSLNTSVRQKDKKAQGDMLNGSENQGESNYGQLSKQITFLKNL